MDTNAVCKTPEQIIKTLQGKADLMPAKDRMAMLRRVAQLTMDYIYNVIVLTRDEQYLKSRYFTA